MLSGIWLGASGCGGGGTGEVGMTCFPKKPMPLARSSIERPIRFARMHARDNGRS